IEKHHPGKLESYFDREDFVYANIPYRIKSYAEILKDPKDTIEFDEELDFKINQLKKVIGADACLMQAEDQSIYTVNFIEKMLAVVLAKLSNFIPEGGIWMNTQRPEWNDANNALVGNGVSMVTLCYLRRFLYFFKDILARSGKERFKASNEMIVSYKRIRETLENHKELLSGAINDIDRKHILDEIGRAASDYRQHIYQRTFWGEKRSISKEGLGRFIEVSLKYIDHTIKSNERPDKLYHAYNLMTIESDKEVSISRLSEMLEGQVAVLSSGYLSAKQSLSVLDGLRNSALFRDDQYSYLLYPDKDLPGFMEKNTIRGDAVSKSSLLKQLLNDDNKAIIARDIQGACHFNGLLKNASDLVIALDQLPEKKYAKLVQTEQHLVLQIFEEVFNHKAFTGRSGTFFGYEGLGSIYWHMVSKLRLATQECTLEAIQQGECAEVIGKLLEHYYEISEGIGVHKPPLLYGAFPTDPYSHTPAGRGAQQPGMTGQVKEDVLCRFGELGVFVKDGRLYFNPCLLRSIEFMEEPGLFEFVNIHQEFEQIPLEKGMLGFTYCQVPVVYKIASSNGLEIVYKDQATTKLESLHLDHASSRHVFGRTGKIIRIEVHMEASQLK
ncbi:MAG: hypothetical protein GY751_02970, partial [Bacteroidetes bacterium]|nr:hypothetical protein [Bacteroidota bacterium]